MSEILKGIRYNSLTDCDRKGFAFESGRFLRGKDPYATAGKFNVRWRKDVGPLQTARDIEADINVQGFMPEMSGFSPRYKGRERRYKIKSKVA